MLSYKNNSINNSFFFYNLWFYLIILLILNPKINLISTQFFMEEIYHQGIRLDDLIILFYLFFLIFNFHKCKLDLNSISRNFLIFYIYFIFSMLNGMFHYQYIESIQDREQFQLWIFAVRYLEYFVLILMITNSLKNINSIYIICKLIILINFIFILLQVFQLVGGFTSVGYMEVGSHYLKRPFGLTGGSWEIGVLLSISFFIILKAKKISMFETGLYFLIVCFCLYVSQSRTNFLAFFVTLFFIDKKWISNYLYLFVLATCMIIISIYNDFVNQLIRIDVKLLIENFIFFFQNDTLNPESTKFLNNTYYKSIVRRLNLVQDNLLTFKENLGAMIFGMGMVSRYLDSLIFRVLFSFGIFGLIVVIFLSRRLPLYLIVYLLIAGSTLDLLLSLKLFFIVVLAIHADQLINKTISNI